MALAVEDISFTFSGGTSNANSDYSLGGIRSNQPIVSNRLFGDLSAIQTANGYTDYRCLYINNTSVVYGLFNSEVYFSYTAASDVSVDVGFSIVDEIQTLTVINGTSVVDGHLIIVYSDQSSSYNLTFNADTDNDCAPWAVNLQSVLRTVPNLEDVEVNVNKSDGDVIFTINFKGSSQGRFHTLLSLYPGGNNLNTDPLNPASTSIVFEKTISGGPVNSTVDTIDVSTTKPANIDFQSSFFVGDLRPLDFLPVWIKRVAPPNSTPIKDDGFILRIKGDAF